MIVKERWKNASPEGIYHCHLGSFLKLQRYLLPEDPEMSPPLSAHHCWTVTVTHREVVSQIPHCVVSEQLKAPTWHQPLVRAETGPEATACSAAVFKHNQKRTKVKFSNNAKTGWNFTSASHANADNMTAILSTVVWASKSPRFHSVVRLGLCGCQPDMDIVGERPWTISLRP